MNFITAVNRVMRTNGIIKGDDDEVLTFNSTQHAATLNIAIIAIQDELNDLVADMLIPREEINQNAFITLVPGVYSYLLAEDFVRFWVPVFRETLGAAILPEYPGGEQALFQTLGLAYRSDTGTPTHWYWLNNDAKRVGLYPMPDRSYLLYYRYERDVSVTNSTSVLPFQTESEAQAFCGMASRRFKALLEENPDPSGYILRDPSYLTAKSRLVNLIRPTNPSKNYGVRYG